MTGNKADADRPVTMADLEKLLMEHETREEERFAQILAGFPDGPENHREYHQKLINAARAEEEFWQTAKVELMKKGISIAWDIIKWVGIMAFLGILTKYGLTGILAATPIPPVDHPK